METALNLAEPSLGGLIHCGLVDRGEEGLDGREAQRAGMREDNVHTPIALGQDALHLGLDLRRRLLIRPPMPAFDEPVILVHAVRAADDKTGVAAEIIDLAINGECDIGILRLNPDLSAMVAS